MQGQEHDLRIGSHVLFGFNSCRLSIAFKPKGVAALSRFNKLAEKFIIICPVAGWFFGMSGNILEKKGQIIFDNNLTPPAFSAILRKPMNKAMMPISGNNDINHSILGRFNNAIYLSHQFFLNRNISIYFYSRVCSLIIVTESWARLSVSSTVALLAESVF